MLEDFNFLRPIFDLVNGIEINKKYLPNTNELFVKVTITVEGSNLYNITEVLNFLLENNYVGRLTTGLNGTVDISFYTFFNKLGTSNE